MDKFNKGRRFGGGSGHPSMFQATCGDCGKQCEVPFKPTGDRPVFCNDCFKKQGGGNDRPSKFGREQRRDRPRFDDKQMFDATCGKCGSKCQVPFRPSPGKQVFCDRCFDKGGTSNKGASDYSGQFKTLNEKLDKLIKLLSPAEEPAKEKENISVKSEVPKKKSVKVKTEEKDKKTTKSKKAPEKKKAVTKKK